jgi:enamine deaminase RidA (YjgF/YER057c/UK114 family)
VLDKIEGALLSLGGTLEQVVRTRVFVDDIAQWEPIARALGERFGHILPANTMVQAQLIGDGYLVEIEADAEL